jgi:hypothetical protein
MTQLVAAAGGGRVVAGASVTGGTAGVLVAAVDPLDAAGALQADSSAASRVSTTMAICRVRGIARIIPAVIAHRQSPATARH